MASPHKSVTETTITFRATSSDASKLKFITRILAKCGRVTTDNQSEALRFLISFNFDLLQKIANKRAEGHTDKVFSVDFSFLELMGKNQQEVD